MYDITHNILFTNSEYYTTFKTTEKTFHSKKSLSELFILIPTRPLL